MPIQKIKSLLPHLAIIAGFFIISMVFCLPAFQGKKLLPHDTYSWLAMSAESRAYHDSTGQQAYWANNMFGGMPTALTDTYTPTNWLQKIAYFIEGYSHGTPHNPAFFFFLAMLGFYAFSASLGLGRWLGAMGAIAFAFSTYNPIIIAAGHATKMLDLAFLPGVLAGVLLVYSGRYWLGGALTALFLSFFIDAGHFQIIFYSIFIILALAIFELVKCIKQGKVRHFIAASLILAVIAALAVGTSATKFAATLDYSKYSMRGDGSELGNVKKDAGLEKEYAFRWSNGIEETMCLLVPNLYGGGSTVDVGEDSHFGEALSSMVPQAQVEQITKRAPLYWGSQQAFGLSGPIYFGAVICFLAILALIVIRNPLKWWMAGTALFFIMLSWGSNFSGLNFFLFDHLPLFNKFRSPNMAMAIASVFFPALAVWGVHSFLYGGYSKEELWQKLKLATGIVGGLVVLILLGTFSFYSFRGSMDGEIAKQFGEAGERLMGALRQDRASFARSDAFRSLVFILLAAAALWAFLKNKFAAPTALAAIFLLIAVDLLPVAHRYLNDDSPAYVDDFTYEQMFAPRPVDAQIMKDPDPYYRVLDLSKDPFNDASSSLHHATVGGYSAAKVQIYQDLIQHQIGRYNTAVLDMLNTKYIISQAGANGQLQAIPNANAMGNAWFVNSIQQIAGAEQEMAALNAPSLQNPTDSSMGHWHPKQTAILRKSEWDKLQNKSIVADPSAVVRLTKYSPDTLSYQSQSELPGLVVFSDIYYPKWWRATIDGKEAPILRADYALRALELPAGQHTIEFSYYPTFFGTTDTIALICSILLIIIAVGGIYLGISRGRNGTEALLPVQHSELKKK